MKGYVLTIEEPGGMRRENISRELAEVAFPWEFFEGIRKDDPSLASLYSPCKNLLYSKRSIVPAELACYASHRAIWRRIVDGSERQVIVFEDDARIVDHAALERALADLSGEDFDLVKLCDLGPKEIVRQRVVGATNLVSHKMLASGTVCYLISKDAACKLLRRATVFRAVDEDMSHAWEFDVDVWSVFPNPVDEAPIAQASSTIASDRKRLGRNGLRSLYGELLQARKKLRTLKYQHGLAMRSETSRQKNRQI